MPWKAIIFILLSFLSTLGDSIFLTGLPLYFYNESGGSLLAATYVSIIITLAVILARNTITRFNKKDPLLLTAYGELAMVLIEAIILIAFFLFPSQWIILIGVLPLAFIYNIYGPSKFLRLQDKLFPFDNVRLSTYQSAMYRLGFFAGIAIAGWVVSKFGATGILIADALSFFIFGTALLFLKNIPEGTETSTVSEKIAEAPSLRLNTNSLIIPLALISLAALFTAWEQGSAIAVVSKANNMPFDEVSYLRSTIGIFGIFLGIGIVHFLPKYIYLAWTGALLATTLGVIGSTFVAPSLGVYLLFLAGGIFSCLMIPAQREIYQQIQNPEHRSDILSNQWIYNSILKFCVPIIALASDHLVFGSWNHLSIALAGILIFGIVGSFLISIQLQSIRITHKSHA